MYTIVPTCQSKIQSKEHNLIRTFLFVDYMTEFIFQTVENKQL